MMLRHAFQVLSQPLPQDTGLFKEVDLILNDVWRCYIAMEGFWVSEVRRVSRALMHPRLDREDGDRWRHVQESLDQTITGWEV
jgi:hypothetical protein